MILPNSKETLWFMFRQIEIFAAQIFATCICYVSFSAREEWSQVIQTIWACRDDFQDGVRSNKDIALWWITSMGRSLGGCRHVLKQEKKGTKVVIWSVVSIRRPLSGVGIHVDESLCTSLYLSLRLVFSLLIFPILPLLCPCFLQFLSTSFPLPSLFIRGNPQR